MFSNVLNSAVYFANQKLKLTEKEAINDTIKTTEDFLMRAKIYGFDRDTKKEDLIEDAIECMTSMYLMFDTLGIQISEVELRTIGKCTKYINMPGEDKHEST